MISGYEKKISDQKYSTGREIERSSKVFARSLVPSNSSLRILDIGCGTGLNAEALTRAGHLVTGVDLSEAAIDKFRKAGFDGYVCNVLEGTPFDDASFDMVFASEVIEHVDDTAAFLAELNRVLRPDGLLLVSTPNSAFWVYRLLAVLGRTVSEVQHPGHVRFFSKRSLISALENSQFSVQKLAGRHMYLIVGDMIGSLISKLPYGLGLTREMRFKTKAHFWHLSKAAATANGFWADTLIALAAKRSRF